MRCSLIIPAAGRGTRFSPDQPKQLMMLCGRSVLARSLDAFAGMVDEAVLAVNADFRHAVQAAVDEAQPGFPVRLVDGGAQRQDSVHAALRACADSSDVVLVHDAVRPLVPRTCIEACLQALTRHDAVLVAIACTSTVKQAQPGQMLVQRTIPREPLWLAQTPQGFVRSLGLLAYARAQAEGWQCSDDAQVLELAGHRVALVPGDARNLKITTRDDWAVAEALLRA
jgi:2-C-methyl-D-erythritol 4-phosphate cytidylyltransferase